MRCKNSADAARQAQANANQTREPWAIFTDTSGNWHAERAQTAPKYGTFTTYHPQPQGWASVETDCPEPPSRPRCSCDPIAPKHSTHRGLDGWIVCADCNGRIA